MLKLVVIEDGPYFLKSTQILNGPIGTRDTWGYQPKWISVLGLSYITEAIDTGETVALCRRLWGDDQETLYDRADRKAMVIRLRIHKCEDCGSIAFVRFDLESIDDRVYPFRSEGGKYRVASDKDPLCYLFGDEKWKEVGSVAQ